ncbi:MAG: hypothetical protein RJQ09_17315 [Cyclobacteriaceae bacterium]
MKITHSKYFWHAITLLSLIVIATSIYYLLGGFKEFELKAYKGIEYDVAGVEFEGKYNDPKIEELFKQAKELVFSNEVGGTLCVIDYLDATAEEQQVHYFIGAILKNRVTELPPGYTVRKISSRGMLSITLDSHPLVRPKKDDIEARMFSLAGEKNLELENFFLEKHFEDNSVIVEGFVK